jgi:hypothetical protein
MFVSESPTHKSDALLMAEHAMQHDYVNVEGHCMIRQRPTAGCEHFVGETECRRCGRSFPLVALPSLRLFVAKADRFCGPAARQPIARREEYMAISQFPNSDAILMSREL